ncbi:hypothetical protein DRB89_41785 [Streptomyces sp. ICC4]|nr:hypothetical protein DRB89_41785 [Streptomyces sp. ICC4]
MVYSRFIVCSRGRWRDSPNSTAPSGRVPSVGDSDSVLWRAIASKASRPATVLSESVRSSSPESRRAESWSYFAALVAGLGSWKSLVYGMGLRWLCWILSRCRGTAASEESSLSAVWRRDLSMLK